jgi:hypothetical protein
VMRQTRWIGRWAEVDDLGFMIADVAVTVAVKAGLMATIDR